MNKFTVLLKIVLLIVVALSVGVRPMFAQDMAKVAPSMAKVVLDNDKVRVFEVHVKAGEKLPMHSHPSSSLVIPITAGKTKTTLAGGKVMETEFKVGTPRWNDAVTHANEALTDIHVMVIELKDQKMMKKK